MTSPDGAPVLLPRAICSAAQTLVAVGGFRDSLRVGESFVLLVVAIAAVIAVSLAAYFLLRTVRQHRHDSHGSLFRGLCRVHGLDRGARALLRQIAAYHGLVAPARLFTEPKWLDPRRLPDPLRGETARVTTIRNRLFSQADP